MMPNTCPARQLILSDLLAASVFVCIWDCHKSETGMTYTNIWAIIDA